MRSEFKREIGKREARRENFAVRRRKRRRRGVVNFSSQRSRKMLTKSLVVVDVGIEKLVEIAKGYFSERFAWNNHRLHEIMEECTN